MKWRMQPRIGVAIRARLVVMALLATLACVTPRFGGGQVNASTVGPQTATFVCLGIPQYFSVPPGVTQIIVDAAGSSGSTFFSSGSTGGDPGAGGTVHATLTVTPGDLLTITVGCMTGYGFARGGKAGPNGHGNTNAIGVGSGGGGATGIADGSTPLLVAGGGGGGGGNGFFIGENGGNGGSGNGSTAGRGIGAGHGDGGLGGGAATPNGGDGEPPVKDTSSGAGGGGGGGYPHGGAGGEGAGAGGGGGGGGGGGQSYADPSIASDQSFGVATSTADGQLTLSYTGPEGTPQTYFCSLSRTDYTVPDGVIGFLVTAIGGDGASTTEGKSDGGAKAGLSGTLQVASGQVLHIQAGCVGNAPADVGVDGSSVPGAGGSGYYPGGSGGKGGNSGLLLGQGGGGGGGASGIGRGEADLFVVAGGGGAGGVGTFLCAAGNGGSADVSAGTDGKCVNHGEGGALGGGGLGINGGDSCVACAAGGGGGGGGGYQSGAGGGAGGVGGSSGGGGGGGVSYTDPTVVSNVQTVSLSDYIGSQGLISMTPLFDQRAETTTVVTVPVDAVYDGTAKTATAQTTDASGNVIANPTVSYTPGPSAPVDAGDYTTSASFAGNDQYQPSDGSANFTIARAPSQTTVTADNAVYDGQPHAATATVTGVGGLSQTLSVMYAGRNTTSYGPSSTPPIAAGDYTASASYAGDTNHLVSDGSKDFIISKAPLSVTADDQSRVYGAANPTFTGSLSGVVAGDNITASYSTLASPSSPVGTYAITPVLNDPDTKLANYSVTSTNGTLTVTAAPLTVTADDATRLVGLANPTFTGTLSGVVNGDNITASYRTTATERSPVGNYPITPELNDPDGRLGNYDVTIVPGTLTVSYGIEVHTSRMPIFLQSLMTMVDVSVVDGQGHNLSSARLTVTALNLSLAGQPWDGTNGNLRRTFRYQLHVAPGGGYELLVDTRNLEPGIYVLSFAVEGDPSTHTLTITVSNPMVGFRSMMNAWNRSR